VDHAGEKVIPHLLEGHVDHVGENVTVEDVVFFRYSVILWCNVIVLRKVFPRGCFIFVAVFDSMGVFSLCFVSALLCLDLDFV
jgi:hypothetical protein